VDNLCVHEHNFSDSKFVVLSESKQESTQTVGSVANVVLSATVWMIHLVIHL